MIATTNCVELGLRRGYKRALCEQQRHALALPRRHVDVGEAELSLKPVVLADPKSPLDPRLYV